MSKEQISGKKTRKKRREITVDTEMPFLEHLEELRWRIIYSLAVVVALAIVAFIYHKFIFDNIIFAPRQADFITNRLLCRLGHKIGSEALCINTTPFNIINIQMPGQFSMHIKVSMIVGFIVAIPVIFYQFWRFVKPAMYTTERKTTFFAVFWTSILFIIGVLFGYYVITPLTVHFFSGYTVSDQISNQINMTSYISVLSSVVLSSGVVFELPVLIYSLSKMGLITPKFLKQYRRHALLLILTLSAIITPPDIFSQILVALPLMMLYEVGIIISRRVNKRRLKAASDG